MCSVKWNFALTCKLEDLKFYLESSKYTTIATRAGILQNNDCREEQGGYVDFMSLSREVALALSFPWVLYNDSSQDV